MPRARRDLQGIGAYLMERSPRASTRVLGALKASIESLSYFPELGGLSTTPVIAESQCRAIPTSYSIE